MGLPNNAFGAGGMTRARIYEPGSEPTSAERHRMARERFKAAGGGRKTVALSAEALQALARLQRHYRLPNATATINWLLIRSAAAEPARPGAMKANRG